MSETTLRRLRPWLGTYVAIEASSPDADRLSLAVEAAFSDVAAIHVAMSFQSMASDLARLHRDAHRAPLRVGWHTWAVLELAIHLARLSDGVFDPSIAPHLVRRGALPRPDGPEPDAGANWRDIELLDDQRVHFRCPLWLDLGGIAKGYAIDRAAETLLGHGVRRGIVNAGGDLRVFGDWPGALPLTVRDPADPAKSIPLGRVRDCAVATSGEFLLGRADSPGDLSPIVDPRRGPRPAQGRSVTVIAGSCAIADGLTKIVGLLGSAAQPLLTHFAATAAILEVPDTVHAAADFWAAAGHAGPPGACHA